MCIASDDERHSLVTDSQQFGNPGRLTRAARRLLGNVFGKSDGGTCDSGKFRARKRVDLALANSMGGACFALQKSQKSKPPRGQRVLVRGAADSLNAVR